MALLIYFPGSQIPLSLIGLMKKREYREPNPDNPEHVHAIIPVKNEERMIPYALGSLLQQDYKRLKVTVVNNLSTDETYKVSKKITDTFPDRMEARVLDNPEPGKTPSIKMAMKERPDCGLTFILDADTYLTDSNYVSTLAAQFRRNKVGSAYGNVKPIRPHGAREAYQKFVMPFYPEQMRNGKSLEEAVKEGDGYEIQRSLFRRMAAINERDKHERELKEIIKRSKPKRMNGPLDSMVISTRASLYSFDQGFIKRGQVGLYGTTTFPVGCGVMYDTEFLGDIFSYYERTLGDNLTTSEDIFLGFAIRDFGRTNLYVPSIHMETTEPKITKYFKQNKAWNSSFIQSSFYFRKNAFKMFSTKGTPEKTMGASIILPLIEKVTYPALLGYFVAVGNYETVIGAAAAELAAYMLVNLAFSQKGYRLRSIIDTIYAEPLRLTSFFSELYTSGSFVKDLITHNRNWRK